MRHDPRQLRDSTEESNFKNITFFILSIVVVAGFLGDKYYDHLAKQRKSKRKQEATNAGAADRDASEETWAKRHAVLTQAVRRVVREKKSLA